MRSKDGRTTKDGIRIHEPGDFAGMHKAGELAAQILDDLARHVAVGQPTGQLDRRDEDTVNNAGRLSAPIGDKR